ncbi:hypothetical protein DDK22_36335 [Cupriavidus necator]|uniref:Uncharacterized protein n=1 Tax=Cupriavidus necator TaxID=106590 RepID=A0A367P7Y2_CUPNE|nr:hypothetical protein DDK22_36335 [Cupriavidus necator]
MTAALDRSKWFGVGVSLLLLGLIFLASGRALAVCTTLATDRTGSLKAGYLSDGTELSTREFVMQYRDGKALVLSASGNCYPRVRTVAQDYFLVSVENCGSAFLPEYWLVRADRLKRRLTLVDYLSPYRFFAAELKTEDSSLSRVRLAYAAQYQHPYQPSEVRMRVSMRGFLFGKQVRSVPVRGAEYMLSNLVLRDLYDAGFEASRIAQPPCGVFSRETRSKAEADEVDICRKRQEIASAVRYLKASAAVRLEEGGSSNRLEAANCNAHVDSGNPYATGVEGRCPK